MLLHFDTTKDEHGSFTHPEVPLRISSIQTHLKEVGILSKMKHLSVEEQSLVYISDVHSVSLIDKVKASELLEDD